ncbi:hypothetical protein BLOT_015701 [Blomia tropicalis]|nr:hypothetical protein BLOT_015701 [Blomia tropicalis]
MFHDGEMGRTNPSKYYTYIHITNGTEALRHEPEGEKWSVTFITGLVKMRKIAIGIIAYGEIEEAAID